MPYAIRKLKNKRCWKVYNKTSGRIHSKCTTRKRAVKQLRLLYFLDKGGKTRRKR